MSAALLGVERRLTREPDPADEVPAEAMLRDPVQYQLVVDAMFELMMSDRRPAGEAAWVNALRRAGREVVLGV